MQTRSEYMRTVRLSDVTLGGKSLIRTASPGVRRAVAVLVDALIVLDAFVLAMLFRFAAVVPKEFWKSFWPFVALSVLVFVVLLFESRAYEKASRYTGLYQGLRVASATVLAAGVLVVATLGIG